MSAAPNKGILIWGMAYGHDPKERHGFIFDRVPMPVNKTRTACGIEAQMICPDPEDDDRYCVVCKANEGKYQARVPWPSQGFSMGEGVLDGPEHH